MEYRKLVKVLPVVRPGAEWLARENPDGSAVLEWLDKAQTIPTDDELVAGLVQVNALVYRDKRAAEYPAIGDQLDAIWKGGADLDAMRAQIMAVKAKYPKS
jgi:hypothetical protein